MVYSSVNRNVSRILARRPDAFAQITGSSAYPQLHGTAELYALRGGVLLTAFVTGLPLQTDQGVSVFGFHIHSGESCTGNADDPFADALNHYNPDGTEHPRHAGDLPPLFAYGGEAYLCFRTEGFTVPEVIGKAVIIHADRDDLTTQPAGDAGKKIGCGVIRRN